MWIAIQIFLALFVVFFSVILIRTFLFVPKKKETAEISPVFVNSEKAAQDLSEMIKCKTISHADASLDDEEEFLKFEKLLPELFPAVYKKCSFEKVGNKSLLFKWSGRSSDAPTVFMAHYDVVSVVEEDWEKPAFSGISENGVLWGRGTLDTKGTLNGILQAAEQLISDGFTPEQDIYFAFGGDEEINGHGAKDIVALFRERGITPSAVYDEGGAVVERVFPGVKSPCALIGIAEKGMLNAEYSISGGGGHSSAPKPHTPVGKLSAACVRVENHPFKYRLTPPTQKMLDTIAPHSTFLYRMIFANLWCFGPVLNLIGKKSG